MRETDFIGQNKEKWGEFEKVLSGGSADAERLSRLFIETTDDLSFSRTYYPNRSVRVYLNGIAQRVYHKVYRNQKKERGRFMAFWKEELPDALWHARKSMLASFVIFCVGMAIGMVSTAYDPGFVNIVLGESYVAMTEENIAKGDPLGVYANGGPMESFLFIAWNNIRVGILCFLLGLLFQAGTVFIVFSNAVMVGAFIWFFVQRGLFNDMFYAVMLHGTLELSMIVLAGAAGLVLGRGLVHPGSYTRLQALLLSARHGIHLMMGVSALLVVAAFIEGFATRYTDAPNAIRGLIILLSAGIVLGYFVWYPWQRYRKGQVNEVLPREQAEFVSVHLNTEGIQANGEVLNGGWQLFMRSFTAHGIAAVGGAALLTALLFSSMSGEALEDFFDGSLFYSKGLIADLLDGFWFWDEANVFFSFGKHPWLYLPMTLVFGLILWNSLARFSAFQSPYAGASKGSRNALLNGLTAGGVLLTPFFTVGLDQPYVILTTVICVIWWPFWLLVTATAHHERVYLFRAIPRALALIKHNRGRGLGAFLSQGVVLWAGMSIVGAPLFFLLFTIVGNNIAASTTWANMLIYALHTLALLTALGLLVPVLLQTFLVLYYTAKEVSDAEHLKKRIAGIRFKNRAYGLEKDA